MLALLARLMADASGVLIVAPLLTVTVLLSLPGTYPVPMFVAHGFGELESQTVSRPFTAQAAAAAMGLRRKGISNSDGASEIARDRTGFDMTRACVVMDKRGRNLATGVLRECG